MFVTVSVLDLPPVLKFCEVFNDDISDLESVNLEFLHPPVFKRETEKRTDSKQWMISNLKHIVRRVHAAISPTHLLCVEA
jgi:hypothetical protein